MMTPMSAASILLGKLLSVLLTLALIMFATLPGYLVMIWIHPPMRWQVWQVLICLSWMALFAMLLSTAVSSLCRRTDSGHDHFLRVTRPRLHRVHAGVARRGDVSLDTESWRRSCWSTQWRQR